MKVVFTAGGTGGHLYPAIAVAEELTAMNGNIDILFIGGDREVERAIIGKTGFRSEPLSVIGMPRNLSPRIATFLWKLGRASLKSRTILKREKPSCLLATGGYVSGPPVLAARSLGIPVCLQEQNSYPGIATRQLARFADTVFLGFSDAAKYLPHATVMMTGNPVRRGIDRGDRKTGAASFGFSPSVKTVFALGGSLGARAVNETVAAIATGIAEQGYQLIWQTGAAEYDRWKTHEVPGRIRVLPYLDNMAQAYAATDLVISRAGAMTLAELTICGLPSILVPLPSAAANHQEHNARSLEHAGAAVVIVQKNLTPDLLKAEVFAILSGDVKRRAMAEASQGMGNRESARVIAGHLLETYGNG